MNKDYLYYRELYHHGIKGQKWGVKNEKEEAPSIRRKGVQRLQEMGATVGGASLGAGAGWLTTFAAAATTKAFLMSKVKKDENFLYNAYKQQEKANALFDKYGDKLFKASVASLTAAGGIAAFIGARKHLNKKNQQKNSNNPKRIE
jgi:hypothetical protein